MLFFLIFLFISESLKKKLNIKTAKLMADVDSALPHHELDYGCFSIPRMKSTDLRRDQSCQVNLKERIPEDARA